MISRRAKKQLASLFVSLLVALLGWFIARYPDTAAKFIKTTPPGSYSVARFDDGDTIQVNMNGTLEKVRFIGVDTPETHDPRKEVQCFGYSAANFTKELIGNQPVRLEADPLSSNRDRYDRLLRYVYLQDGRLVQAEIIKQGYGFAYTSFPFTKNDEFVHYQREARENNRGLWNDCTPQTNDYGGFTSNNATE